MTLQATNPTTSSQPPISLGYLSPNDQPRRPIPMSVIGTLSIIFGILGSLVYLAITLFSLMSGPSINVGPAPASDLPIFYSAEFYLCGGAMVWLFISGLRVFTWDGHTRLTPHLMLIIYVAAKFVLWGCYCVLILAHSFESFGNAFGPQFWTHDMFFWLVAMCGYPLTLIFVLRLREVRDYYARRDLAVALGV